jgi:uncharacterized protein (TIGR00106 family)
MRNQVIAEVTVVPLGTKTPQVSPYVAHCIDVLRKAQGISFQITPMGTIIQGPMARVLELVAEMHEVPFTEGAGRVVTTLKIDDRRDKLITMDSKVRAVS